MNPVIIVLGANGFIGRHVCRALSQQALTVFGLGHGHWSTSEQQDWGLSRWIEADINVGSLTKVLDGRPLCALIHCAGGSAVGRSFAEPHSDFRRTMDSTAELLEFARTLSGERPRVVLTSSAAVYGDQGDVDVTESATRSPVSPYGFHKLMAENLCDSWSRFFGVRISVVRLFSVYGEGLRKQLLWDAANKYTRGDCRFFGTGHEVRDWVHVDDAARLLCLAATTRGQDAFEIYNGGQAHHTTTSTVLTELGSLLGSTLPPIFTGETHVGNPRRLTANSRHAHRQLGWRPEIALTEGLERYVKWFHTSAHSKDAA